VYNITILILTAICAVAAIITALPVLGSWFQKQRPDAKINQPSKLKWWGVFGLSMVALVFSGIGLHRTFLQGQQKGSLWSANLETVYDKSYVNETLAIDGKLFTKCHFTNVKLIYHGSGPTGCNDCSFAGDIYVGSDNVAISQFMKLDREFRAKLAPAGTYDLDSNGNVIPPK
jgi:hypothetical protein